MRAIQRIRQEIARLDRYTVDLDVLLHVPTKCGTGYAQSKCFADDELEDGELVLPSVEWDGGELFVEGGWRSRVGVYSEEGSEFIDGFGFPEGVRA